VSGSPLSDRKNPTQLLTVSLSATLGRKNKVTGDFRCVKEIDEVRKKIVTPTIASAEYEL
jgi:hypothetical protein